MVYCIVDVDWCVGIIENLYFFVIFSGVPGVTKWFKSGRKPEMF